VGWYESSIIHSDKVILVFPFQGVDIEKKRSDIAMALMELMEKSDFVETLP